MYEKAINITFRIKFFIYTFMVLENFFKRNESHNDEQRKLTVAKFSTKLTS